MAFLLTLAALKLDTLIHLWISEANTFFLHKPEGSWGTKLNRPLIFDPLHNHRTQLVASS